MTTENTVFKLIKIEYCDEKPQYPEFKVSRKQIGIFSSLAKAEQAMKEEIKRFNSEYDYGYWINEYVIDNSEGDAARIRRSYLSDGSPLDETIMSEIEGEKYVDLEKFYGRKIRFKEGDLVEVTCGETVSLEIVFATPPTTVEEVKFVMDHFDDGYTTLPLNDIHRHPDGVYLFPPRLPVSDELRKNLKKEFLDYTNFHYGNPAYTSENGKLKERTMEELENDIITRWKHAEKKTEADEQLEEYLDIRRYKMNKNFEWTPENIDKLLALNQKFISCFEKLIEEATPVVKALQKSINDKDSFLHDFEIEANIKPSILVSDEDGEMCEPDDGIEQILMANLPEHILNFNPKHYIIEDNINNNIHFNKELSWNIEWLDKISDDHYICYAIHELCHHTCWSIPDILKINNLWSQLRVVYQNDSFFN
ncbi:MAG: hypothetical protein FWH18_10730 [Marinilabiliaceae bacterium]|nr:hypothetical protein [Marinilabiliaceae bacterium]